MIFWSKYIEHICIEPRSPKIQSIQVPNEEQCFAPHSVLLIWFWIQLNNFVNLLKVTTYRKLLLVKQLHQQYFSKTLYFRLIHFIPMFSFHIYAYAVFTSYISLSPYWKLMLIKQFHLQYFSKTLCKLVHYIPSFQCFFFYLCCFNAFDYIQFMFVCVSQFSLMRCC